MELHGNAFKKGNDAMAPPLPAPTQSQCWTFARSSSTPPNPSRSEALHSTQSPLSTSTGSTSWCICRRISQPRRKPQQHLMPRVTCQHTRRGYHRTGIRWQSQIRPHHGQTAVPLSPGPPPRFPSCTPSSKRAKRRRPGAATPHEDPRSHAPEAPARKNRIEIQRAARTTPPPLRRPRPAPTSHHLRATDRDHRRPGIPRRRAAGHHPRSTRRLPAAPADRASPGTFGSRGAAATAAHGPAAAAASGEAEE